MWPRHVQDYVALGVFLIALLLAATNQIFSLLDPLIFRHVIDGYATKYNQFTQGQFIRGPGLKLFGFRSRLHAPHRDRFIGAFKDTDRPRRFARPQD